MVKSMFIFYQLEISRPWCGGGLWDGVGYTGGVNMVMMEIDPYTVA